MIPTPSGHRRRPRLARPITASLVGAAIAATGLVPLPAHADPGADPIAEYLFTQASGTSGWSTAYTPPANWRVVSVNPTTASVATAVATSHDVLTLDRPGGEVVDRFEVYVDRDGDEAGSYTSVIVHWRRVDIVIEQAAPDWTT